MNTRTAFGGKAFALLLALVLVLGSAIGGTLAWLADTTSPVVNTFTYGNIIIELIETTGKKYKILPGNDINKDPRVIVKAGSEACWLFVKVEENGDFVEVEENGQIINRVTWSIREEWTKLDGVEGVYYRQVPATSTDPVSFYILAGSQAYSNGVILVSEDLTKGEVNAVTNPPSLTFTAYAVQRDENIDTVEKAWAQVSP